MLFPVHLYDGKCVVMILMACRGEKHQACCKEDGSQEVRPHSQSLCDVLGDEAEEMKLISYIN